jgi:hypothetical protein
MRHGHRCSVVLALALVACVAALGAFGAPPAAASTVFRGTVRGADNGQPLSDIRVMLFDDWSDMEWYATTDAMGQFELGVNASYWEWEDCHGFAVQCYDFSRYYETRYYSWPGWEYEGVNTADISLQRRVPALPETSIDSGPSGVVDSTPVTFKFSADRSQCTFECRLDSGSWETSANPKTYVGLKPGDHVFEVRAIDRYGDADPSPAARTFAIADLPDTIIDTGPSGTVGPSTADFTFSADEAGCTYESKLDSGSWEVCTSPKSYVGLTEGSHTFAVRAIDADGYADPSPATCTWTIAYPPETTIDSGPSGFVAADSATFTFAADKGSCTFECRLDGGSWEDCSLARSDFATGDEPLSVAVGDFNDDGSQDLVTANYSANSVSVLPGDGRGGFGPATDLTTGGGPRSVVVVDLNTDGNADLVTANYSAGGISVLLGDGSGGFGARADFATFPWPWSLAVGDFNSDSKTDVVAVRRDAAGLSMVLGNGSGCFGTSSDFGIGGESVSVAVGDFNKDGKADLATADVFNSRLIVLLGNGGGGFSTMTYLKDGSTTEPTSVTVGDFNNDGNTDLAAALSRRNQVSVSLGNGSGGFGSRRSFWTGNGDPQSIAVADLNNDGDADLVTANNSHNTSSVLLGDGTGGFGANTEYAIDGQPRSVAVGDFNNDGRQDVVTANSAADAVSVLLGDGTGSFHVKNYAGLTDGPHTFEVRATGPAGTIDPTPASWTWIVDRTAPSTADDGDALWHSTQVTLTLVATDPPDAGATTSSGVDKTEYRLDGGPWTGGSQATVPAPTDHSSDGAHALEYRSVDKAGNVEKTKAVEVKIDTTAPTPSCSDDGSWHKTGVPVTFDAADAPSGVSLVEYRLTPDQPWIAGRSVTLPTASKVWQIAVRATDEAGNLSEPLETEVRVDCAGPRTRAAGPVEVSRGQIAKLGFYVRDDVSPRCTATIVVFNARGRRVARLRLGLLDCRSRQTAQFAAKLPRGVYHYRILARDLAGNTQTHAGSSRLVVR